MRTYERAGTRSGCNHTQSDRGLSPVESSLHRPGALDGQLLTQLGDLGPQYTVITGVLMDAGTISNLGYDKKSNTFWIVNCDYLPVSYPGTGDIFASVLTGAFLSGDSLPIAMGKATCFAEECIKTTFSYSTDTRHGVMLEKVLAMPDHRFGTKPYSIL